MKSFQSIAQTLSAQGDVIKLVRRSDEYIILANGAILMSSRMHGSEEALATLACRAACRLRQPRILIGGLGMGFTLRATLDLLSPHATVVVAELITAVVEWNHGPLGPLARYPLRDKRVRVEIRDVAATLRLSPGLFDAVLLDVDNGPIAFTVSDNAGLYGDRGIATTHAALKSEGVLGVWSAQDDQKFQQRLRRGGFDVETQRVRGRLQKGGSRHTILLGRKREAVLGRRWQ